MISDTGQVKLMGMCRSNWGMFKSKDADQGFLHWFQDSATDENAAFDSLRCIEKDRIGRKAFKAYDKPSLLEWKYLYNKELKKAKSQVELVALKAECGWCLNRGRRYLVIHAGGGSEGLVTELPANDLIMPYVYSGTIPCTCTAGQALMDHAVATQQKAPMHPDKWHDIVTNKSHNFTDCNKLLDEYIKVRNVKYHGMTMKEQEPDPRMQRQFMNLVKAAASGKINLDPPKYERRKKHDPVQHAITPPPPF